MSESQHKSAPRANVAGSSPLQSGQLAGQTVVVTGASDGVGRAAVRFLLDADAHVVMVGRNEAKTRAAASSLMSEAGKRLVSVEIADLSLQREVRDLGARIASKYERIDVLVNNAGALFLEREETSEGLERTFALNHLAYFTLTLLLLPRLLARGDAGPARIINVSSRAHVNAKFVPDDLQVRRGYTGWRAYRRSKLHNVLFTRALARRLDPSVAVVHALHPGLVATRFARNNGAMGRLMRRIMDLRSISPARGADTLAWLCGSPDAPLSTGDYWVRRRRVKPSRVAQNDTFAEQLWEQSAALAGLDIDAARITTPTPGR